MIDPNMIKKETLSHTTDMFTLPGVSVPVMADQLVDVLLKVAEKGKNKAVIQNADFVTHTQVDGLLSKFDRDTFIYNNSYFIIVRW